MRKILLSCVFCFCGFSFANAACTPPATLKCECQHPIIENGQLVCGPSYCAENTNCMPNGSCCPTANYCNSTEQGKQCCEEGQTCDTTKGCVEGIFDCTNGLNKWLTIGGKKFYISGTVFTSWYDAEEFCVDNGMNLASIYELCSDDWNGYDCPNVKGVLDSSCEDMVTSTISDLEGDGIGYAFIVNVDCACTISGHRNQSMTVRAVCY